MSLIERALRKSGGKPPAESEPPAGEAGGVAAPAKAPPEPPERPAPAAPEAPDAAAGPQAPMPGEPAAEPRPEPGPAGRAFPREVRGPVHPLDLGRLRLQGLLTPDDTRSRLAEEFRIIKRPIINNAFGEQSRRIQRGNVVMITSSLPGEGKSFCTINLALSICREIGRTVLLVDADVARPAVPHYLGLPDKQRGLLDVIMEPELDLSDVILRTDLPNFSVVPAGTTHGHSTELLASAQMGALVREMAERYPDRIVLFDSPPLAATSEAGVLASHMGQILVVVEAQRTPQTVLESALHQLDACDVVMTMLNKNRALPGVEYGGYYGGYY